MIPARTPAAAVLGLVLAAALGARAGGPVFRADDPLLADRDDLPAPAPASHKLSDVWEILRHSFSRVGDRAPRRALDANTLGEVPDSSWFTNRIDARPLSLEEIAHGPSRLAGVAAGPLVVTGAKSEGVTPGFRVQDSAGNRFLVKFDPPGNPEMATGAEMVSTRLFHALGYHVPENYLHVLDPSSLTVKEGATYTDFLGRKRPLTLLDVDRLLDRVEKLPDGRIRALASRFLEGTPVGPFEFHGTRSDDANDVLAHEDRRTLRGYRVFCAWLNHDDSRAINTLDTYVGEPGAGHVRHHLIDFGSTLGSASVRPDDHLGNYEYFFEAKPTLATLASLGLWVRPPLRARFSYHPSLGRLEQEGFDPVRWRPEYPSPAFSKMDAEDAFWAAKKVARFDDAALRAVVAEARFSDPAAADALVRYLADRRDAVVRAFLPALPALDRFGVEDGRLGFADLLAEHGLAAGPSRWHASVHAFENATGERGAAVGDPVEVGAAEGLALPRAVADAGAEAYFVVVLEGASGRVEVFLRRRAGALEVVGIERHAPGVR